MALSKKEDFEKNVDNEVKKGIDDQEQSEMCPSDDDSLMHEINRIGENTPFGGIKQQISGPNLISQSDGDYAMMFNDEGSEANQMIQKMMKTGTNLNSRELEQFLDYVKSKQQPLQKNRQRNLDLPGKSNKNNSSHKSGGSLFNILQNG